MNELVSIIIPTYKNRGNLKNSIISVLRQDYENKEIIVVDDNSLESKERQKTEKVMKEFEAEQKVIYLRHPENKNGAAARNTGIKASKGEYIAFLDDDDLFLPNKISKQVEYLENHPEFDGVYCMAKRKGKPYGTDKSEGDCTRELLMLQTCIYTPCQMFRRDAIVKINGYDESFRRHQDFDLLLRFFHAGFKIGCLPEILTEIGTNGGENIPSGEKMEELKNYFFEKFMPYINEIEAKESGFKNKVLAKHYAGVFLNHVKHKEIKMAVKTFCKNAVKSPTVFFKVIIDSATIHLKGEA